MRNALALGSPHDLSPVTASTAAVDLPCRGILGVDVAATTSDRATSAVLALVASGGHGKFAFLNANAANLAWDDPAFRAALRSFTVFPDGVGVDLAARVLHGAPFPENLNGTDFVPHLLHRADRPLTVGLLGARPGVVAKARDRFATAFPDHAFRIVNHGYFETGAAARIARRLAARPVDVLLVALGNPQQERFIAEAIDGRHCRAAFGIGALFDFTSGHVPRAPRMMRDLRLEWLFRFNREPERMWRRYVVGNPLFLARVLHERRRMRRGIQDRE